MSESIRQTIEELKRHVADLEAQAIDTKRTVNSLCRVVNEPAAYSDEEMAISQVAKALQGDEYVGKPLASAVRLVLEARKKAGQGPATLDDLFVSLEAGGYEFDSKNDETSKRGLAISLAKNTTTFYKLSGGKFGLAEWYNKETKARSANGGGRKAVAQIDNEDDSEEIQVDFSDMTGKMLEAPVDDESLKSALSKPR